MSYDRMRLYDAGRFQDTELPDWYHEAERLSETERLAIMARLEERLNRQRDGEAPLRSI